MKLNVFSQKPLNQSSGGYILVAALMILLVLTLIGIAGNRHTTTELQVAANDKVYRQSFYQADGGTEYAAELLEQNIACIGFANNGSAAKWLDDATGPLVIDDHIAVENGSLNFWQNSMGTWLGNTDPDKSEYPTDTNRNIFFPPDYSAGEPHTNITIEGRSDLTAGSSIIMAAGYIGLGRSMSSGGVSLDYEIYAKHIGLDNSENVIRVEWRHVVGREDPYCNYD